MDAPAATCRTSGEINASNSIARLPSLDRLELSDDEAVNRDCTPAQERPSRLLRVSGLDGKGVDVEIHSRDSVGMIKQRISAALGVHKDLQDVFDEQAEEPFEDDYELPEDTTELIVINKNPDLHKVTPGPPLNCRVQAHREAKVVASFQPNDIVKVIGDRTKGGTYGENHTDWVPILVEVKKQTKKDQKDKKEGAEEEEAGEDQMEIEKEGSEEEEEGQEMELVKAWCACGSAEEAYLVGLTDAEQQEYYLRG